MKYIEAYEAMKDGHSVSRRLWDIETSTNTVDERYCIIQFKVPNPMMLRHIPSFQWSGYMPSIEDTDADDWYIRDTTWNQSKCVDCVTTEVPKESDYQALKNLVDEALPVDASVM